MMTPFLQTLGLLLACFWSGFGLLVLIVAIALFYCILRGLGPTHAN